MCSRMLILYSYVFKKQVGNLVCSFHLLVPLNRKLTHVELGHVTYPYTVKPKDIVVTRVCCPIYGGVECPLVAFTRGFNLVYS